ncbi:hypothetical protein [Helicobacter rodentium]|nr:hypothetical protein [Helicobacter rodentium]
MRFALHRKDEKPKRLLLAIQDSVKSRTLRPFRHCENRNAIRGNL